MIKLPRLNTFAERLVWARLQIGMTQDELAEASGIRRDALAKAETGKTKRPKRMKELADALGVPPAWLAFGEDKIDMWDEDTLNFADMYQRLDIELKLALKTIVQSKQDYHPER